MTAAQIADNSPDMQRYYRAGAAYALAHNRFLSGYHGSSMQWCVLTHIADWLGSEKKGKGKTMLAATLGLPKGLIKKIETLVFYLSSLIPGHYPKKNILDLEGDGIRYRGATNSCRKRHACRISRTDPIRM